MLQTCESGIVPLLRRYCAAVCCAIVPPLLRCVPPLLRHCVVSPLLRRCRDGIVKYSEAVPVSATNFVHNTSRNQLDPIL